MNRQAIPFWAFGVGWVTVALAGFWLLERYDTTPGTVGPAPAAVPEAAGRWRLTVFAHPRCPCTRTTLRELADLCRDEPGLAVRVLFTPAGAGDVTDLPDAEVGIDPTGSEARRFGAETSGFAVLTDPGGRVVFRGGLTPARGRAGENAGRQAVRAWVGGRVGAAEAPVFGCPLFAGND